MAGTGLQISQVDHSYAGKQVLHGVDFTVPDGKVVALLGPSGCGKSTILRAIAGLIVPDGGRILLNGRDLTQVPVRNRQLGMVFQNFALFSHMTVAENVAYGLTHLLREDRRERVAKLLDLVRLTPFADRFPPSLSGGQQQRVAVARALATEPAALLMDEPFGALDRALRAELQAELVRMQDDVGITTVMVTHDQEEAQAVAEQLVIMNEGRVEQVGTPEDIYDNPASLFVNGFIGHANRIAATVTGSARLKAADGTGIAVPVNFIPGSGVVVTCRPEELTLSLTPTPDAFPARFDRAVVMGRFLMIDATLADGTAIKAQILRDDAARPEKGQPVWLTPDTTRLHVFPSTPDGH
ncbi:ABC transporter ATP-binding protein [Falsirhodobacter halotolerans]|uniref:ABC transporter ATP-binding protein n=1 Tax=Falsirhodobacter halotolerans TaxID=1146892 RepID=UPI001FD08A07|nr:ABC transporter ATP-binding protein [Falsirhodobacter halotolerans]MCJ8139141.1 ABC transporter ATP-binding protein [Falsirhodobacter halotolerans]